MEVVKSFFGCLGVLLGVIALSVFIVWGVDSFFHWRVADIGLTFKEIRGIVIVCVIAAFLFVVVAFNQ